MMIILILVLIAVSVSVFMVPTDMLKETPFLASEASVKKLAVSEGSYLDLVSLTPISGCKICINGQECRPCAEAVVDFNMTDPCGKMNSVVYIGDTGPCSVYGQNLYIYQRPGDIVLNTGAPSQEEYKNIVPFDEGIWALTMVDQDSQTVIFYEEFSLAGGANILSGTMWSNGTMKTPDGTEIGVTNHGTTQTTGPGGMTANSFDGSSYIEVDDDEAIDLSGDMTISFWMNPSQTTGYHNLLGKGLRDENDNYDIFIIDNEIWFEWNDVDSTEHRHIKTDTADLAADDQLKYVTITVKDDLASIYVDATDYDYRYYKENHVGASPVAEPFNVNMEGNDQNLHIGKQNWGGGASANDFYYEGDMGEIAFYDRALTDDEITYNYNNYLV